MLLGMRFGQITIDQVFYFLYVVIVGKLMLLNTM